ncbi:cation transporter dimerization domain-containing protein, partial [Klebsiella pneumoniae]
DIEALEQVISTHDAHLWSLDGESHVFTVHVVVPKDADAKMLHEIKGNIRSLVAKKGRIHLTVELEEAGIDCPAVHCVGTQS